ncbi:MAG TPA: asparaginase [Egibacteraceae bacterium]|nr:asparaginase [Egibacteraceae bacterium]
MSALDPVSMRRCPPLLAHVVRDGVVESAHSGDLVVAGPAGEPQFVLGDPDLAIYPRSAIKPFQALACLSVLNRRPRAAAELSADALAIACASHSGSAEHQIEAAHLLALAGLDETALQCPEGLPRDIPALVDQRGEPTRLAHNCSGKHALLAWAQSVAAGDARHYLNPASAVQLAVRDCLERVGGSPPAGPGVDGCGAPAWVMRLRAVAAAFASLAAGDEPGLALVRDAMRARPDLVGDPASPDTRLMAADSRVVAKAGAEAVFGAGFQGPEGAVGIAVKIADGGGRAAAPAVAAALRLLGATVPEDVLRPRVLGGGSPRGALETAPMLAIWPG